MTDTIEIEAPTGPDGQMETWIVPIKTQEFYSLEEIRAELVKSNSLNRIPLFFGQWA